jgi:hypothetical protein
MKIHNQETSISLRLIDWFVTNFSRDNDTSFPDCQTHPMLIHDSYKSQLKAYSKKQFDPFCRRTRINFYYEPDSERFVVTTVGQLNFFRWFISNSLLHFIEKNLEEIELDMKTKNTNGKRKSKKKINKNNENMEEFLDLLDPIHENEESVASTKTMKKNKSITKQNVKMTVYFS